MLKKIISLILVFFLAVSCLGQKFSFLNYSTKLGLAQSQIVDIKQDKNQYLWIATLGGLSKFDGQKFESFYEKDGLASSTINSIFIDEENSIWVVTRNGISIIEGDTIRAFGHNSMLDEYSIEEVIIQGNKIWISTQENGVFSFKKEKDIHLPTFVKEYRIDFSELKIRDIEIVNKSLYVSTNNGIYTIENDMVSKLSVLRDEDISSIDVNSIGDLWISTFEHGVYSLSKGGTLIHINQNNSDLLNDFTTHLVVGGNDKVWVSSKSALAEITSETKMQNYTKSNGFDYIPEVVFEDDEGNIWIGTNGKGLVKLTNKEFLYFTKEKELHSDLILSICEDTNGSIWLGAYGQGICNLNGKSITSYNARHTSLPNNTIWTSILDKNNKLWVGTSDGLSCFSDNSFMTFTEKDGLPSNKIQSLFQEVKGVLWIGTRKGLAYYKDHVFHTVDSFPFTNVRSIALSEDGIYWLGTSQGLVAYDGFRSKLIEDDLLKGNTIYSLVAKDNQLWIGSEKGLIHYDGKEYKRHSFSSENDQSPINFLLNDKSNYLWIGTNRGVFTLNLTAFQKGKNDITSYTTNNGLIGMETNLNAIFEDSKGNVWMGTSDGINVFKRTNEELATKAKPSIHLTNVKLFFKEKNWLNELNGDNDVCFKHNNNTFTFYYHSNYFKDPSAVKYSYMLEGSDESWSPMESTNFSRYPNLTHGDYTFQVKATVDGEIWSDIEQVSFTIKAPFWLTWWFRIVFLVALFLIGFYIFNRRRKAVLKQREVELLNYKNKLIKLEQQSLNASMNRHFIFNSLNSIQFYINKEDKLSANRYLSNFSKLIRKNLDSSSNEDSLIPLSEEIERLSLYLSLENMRFKEKFSYDINIDDQVDTEVTKVPAMFMQPFIENCIWHGILPMEKPGEIAINIYKEEEKTYFEIIDNGIGINTSLRNKSQDINEHSSKGMKIATNRIELLQKVIESDIIIDGPKEMEENGKILGTKVVIIFS